MVVLRVQHVHFDDFNHATGIDGDKMVWVINGIPVPDKLVSLVGSGDAILPVILSALPPVANGSQDNPAQNHDEHQHPHENCPMETPRWRSFLMENNPPISLLDDLVASGVGIADSTTMGTRFIDRITFFVCLNCRIVTCVGAGCRCCATSLLDNSMCHLFTHATPLTCLQNQPLRAVS